jgi:hypothetical protein
MKKIISILAKERRIQIRRYQFVCSGHAIQRWLKYGRKSLAWFMTKFGTYAARIRSYTAVNHRPGL